MAGLEERVRSLIAASGLTQRAYAEKIGLDTTKLSKSLAGGRRFTSLELARISELSEVTVDWLITGSEPALTIAARSSGGSAATAIQEAERLSSLRSDLTFLGFGQPWRPVEGEVPQLAELARRRVAEAGRSTTEPDLAAVIEAVFGVDVAVCALGSDFDGLSVSNAEVKLILVATSQVPARQRFTMAHELGHLLVGDDQQVHVDSNIFADEYRTDRSERRANAFAAALLMPEEAVRAALGAGDLTADAFARHASEFVVSPSSLALRMHDLGLIDAVTYARLRKMSGAEAARLADRGEDFALSVSRSSTARPPGLLLRDTYRAYESGEATLRPYANLIGTDSDTLRESLESDE